MCTTVYLLCKDCCYPPPDESAFGAPSQFLDDRTVRQRRSCANMTVSLQQAYLAAYNALLGLGWAACALVVLFYSAQNKDLSVAYNTAVPLANWLQAVSILETVHAALGLVRSGVLMNFLQWTARSHALFLAVNPEPSLHAHPAAALMLFSWGLGEACRYPWYTLTQLGNCPFAITWLRYSGFVVMYPLGLVAELWCMWMIIPIVATTRRLSLDMPNPANMAYDYAMFLRVVLVVQPLVWLQLYSSLWRQRNTKLSKGVKGD
eukprot:jgi/Ulvmu1/5300/UM022_0094.1